MDFSVEIRSDTKFRHRKHILCTIASVTSFPINYNKTHKWQIKYEIKYYSFKISTKNKKPKKPKYWTFENF